VSLVAGRTPVAQNTPELKLIFRCLPAGWLFAQLAERRPNVSVLEEDPDPESDSDGREKSSDEFEEGICSPDGMPRILSGTRRLSD
jgi:hypothetical protein